MSSCSLPLRPPRLAAPPPAWAPPPAPKLPRVGSPGSPSHFFLKLSLSFLWGTSFRASKKSRHGANFLSPYKSEYVFILPPLNWPGCYFTSWIESSRPKAFFAQTFEGIAPSSSQLAFETSHVIMTSSSLYMTFFSFLKSFGIFALSLVLWNFAKLYLQIWIFFHLFCWASTGPFNLKLNSFSYRNLLTVCLIISHLLCFLISGILFHQLSDLLKSPTFRLLIFSVLWKISLTLPSDLSLECISSLWFKNFFSHTPF